MAPTANSGLSIEVAAAFAWWRDAGVDRDFLDEPLDWLARDEVIPSSRPAPVSAIAPPPPAPPTLDPTTLPADLAAFTAWWMSEPLLDHGRTAGRVPPRGEPGADTMILVPEPEPEDDDHLLSGPQGRLVDAILLALGMGAGQAYLASALPRHTPMADWTEARRLGLGQALIRHIELAAPRRLIVFGGSSLSLLGHDPPNSSHFFLPINHDSRSIPLLAAPDPGSLLARPRAKARLWQDLLRWTGAGMDGRPD